MKNIKVAPSILSGDFGHLADEAKRVEDAGADYLHVDIMDGNFVRNITIGPDVVAAINRATDIFLDVHLMIYNPFEYIERFVAAGADMLTIQLEATEEIEETLNYIRKCGIKAGLALNPETSPTLAINYLDKCDMLLMMTVNPGFGGQSFMPQVLDKIKFIREMCDKLQIREGGKIQNSKEKLPPFDIEVDGGINAETAQQCVLAGANVLVSGSYLFGVKNMTKAIKEMK